MKVINKTRKYKTFILVTVLSLSIFIGIIWGLVLKVSGPTLESLKSNFSKSSLIIFISVLIMSGGILLIYLFIQIIKKNQEAVYLSKIKLLEVENENLIETNHQQKLEFETYKRELIQEKETESAEQISHYIASTTHEIRNFINGVHGMLQLLMSTPLTDDQKEYVEISKEAVDSLLKNIHHILAFSKLEANEVVLEKRVFDLKQLLEEIKYTSQYTVLSETVIFDIQVDQDCPSYLIGDAFRLREILMNLIGNAIKYTEQGFITVSVAATSIIESRAIQLRFSVKDTGIGIKNEQLEKIFDSYQQADLGIYRLYGGTGLGLFITKKLVEKMGGTISVTSEYGKGSEFSFTAMFEKTKVRPRTLNHGIINLKNSDRTCNLLVVDDDPVARYIMKRFSEINQWQVDVAKNGEEALNYYTTNTYDVIIMDLEMSEMNGYEITKKIRTMEGDCTPIIAITAHTLQKEKEKCLECGMDDFISKPVDREEFFRIVSRWL